MQKKFGENHPSIWGVVIVYKLQKTVFMGYILSSQKLAENI